MKIQRTLFSDLNLSCRKGEIIGLIGRNGSGKSTILKTIAGLLKPLHGSIFMNDITFNRFSRNDLAKQISFVSTEIPVIPNISVNDLVSLGRYPYTDWTGRLSSEDIMMVNKSIEQVNLGDISGNLLSEISDGERQRVMIGRALAQDTEIIILDEPTAFLDLPNRYEILRLLNNLAVNRGKTILFSTHDLGIALHEADTIWMLLDGKIITGAPEDLIINKEFFKLFEDSSLRFDVERGEIRPERNYISKIGVKGTGSLRFWTVHALERLGIEAVENDEIINLIVEQKGDDTVWCLIENKNELKFPSIYKLCLHLRSIINQIV